MARSVLDGQPLHPGGIRISPYAAFVLLQLYPVAVRSYSLYLLCAYYCRLSPAFVVLHSLSVAFVHLRTSKWLPFGSSGVSEKPSRGTSSRGTSPMSGRLQYASLTPLVPQSLRVQPRLSRPPSTPRLFKLKRQPSTTGSRRCVSVSMSPLLPDVVLYAKRPDSSIRACGRQVALATMGLALRSKRLCVVGRGSARPC